MTRTITVASALLILLAIVGCDPIGQGVVAPELDEAQLRQTVHPTHNPYWTRALGPAASGDFHCLAIADFDGDSLPDIAAGAYDRRGIRIWLANGDGTWSSIDGPAYYGQATGLATADVNKDGRPDLIVCGRGEVPGVRVWLNTDEMAWKEGEPATITQNYTRVKTADLNGDGYPDVFAARDSEEQGGNGGVGVWINRAGKGWSTDIGPKSANTYNDLALADFNNDTHLDLVGARWGAPGGLDIWYGNGQGSWARAKEDPAVKFNFQGVDVGDFNGDGFTDIVATSYRSQSAVCIFLNDRSSGSVVKQEPEPGVVQNTGSAQAGWWSQPVVLAGIGSYWDAKAVDVNGDKLLDVVATSFDGRGIRVWLQLPPDGDEAKKDEETGKEEKRRPFKVAFLEQSFRFPHKGTYYGVASADFNTDGAADLVAVTRDQGVKAWYQTDQQGRLKLASKTRAAHISAAFPRPFGEEDEVVKDPAENSTYLTLERDDGRKYTEYRIGTGDVLKIEMYRSRVEKPEVLNKPVGASGELLIPEVSADPLRIVAKDGKGLTPSQLRNLILQKLRDEVKLRNPAVSVTVSDYRARKASVLGEVRIKVNQTNTGPGEYPLTGKTRVLQFIARHGGFTPQADLTKVEVRHRGGEKRVLNLFKAIFQSKLSQDVVLDENDVVYVPSTTMSDRKLYVLGQVAKPGIYSLRDNVRLIEAVQLASSFTPRANRKQVIVIRGDKRKPDLFQINMLEMLKNGDLSKNMLLKDGDIVYVPTDWIGNLREFYSWFLPTYDEAMH
jgi:protein involved in polysaccharide export with SLBB domain